jgi:hypothetical protein
LNAALSGVYRPSPAPARLRQAAARGGLVDFSVDLAEVNDKARFLAVCAARLGFPPSFGSNWDAFADSLQDFSWCVANGYLIHFWRASVFARAVPRDYATALEILRAAAEFWKDRGRPFIVLIDGAPDLPELLI